ncbi:hypothetical protein KSS87_010428 [Heliosperma pusillum]|nr:hypothetical protein KSS87_010428 [Heliosperma pusillum]
MSTTETNPVADTTATPFLSSTNTDIHRSLGGECVANSTRPAICRPEPVSLVFELIWSMVIVSVAIVVLTVLSKGETTEVPVRVWIVGFVVLRFLRMVCVCLDYLNRRQVWEALTLDPDSNIRQSALGRVAKCIYTVNTVLSLIWWIVGLYWMFSGGTSLADDAPKLFWSTVIFLALDLFVILIFAFVSCFLCVAGYCFLKFIMPFLNNDPHQNGANEARFTWNFSTRLGAIQESPDGSINDRDTDTPTKHVIAAENATGEVYPLSCLQYPERDCPTVGKGYY